ncbi:hypothetical protein H5V44_11495 [Halobellus sp. MBLA0160]|uniref:Uncharacterized protein n=1 Tax=Halobellus ruber TaxID=2761102 RepID=A0A7J9SIW3_9EURY|nr:hypothetical protein [Halobellus ruber]
MNHVPDAVLAAIDGLGRAALADEPTTVEQRLRGDFRVRISCDRTALDAGTVPVAFRLEHGTTAPTLRDHGSFVVTIVDGVDSRLRAWGIDPPDAYTHRRTDDEWQVYAGRATLR